MADDAIYRAIGRYVVSFSQLIFFMRQAMVQRLMKQGEGVGLAELAFGSASADQIASSFFDMCEHLIPRSESKVAGEDDDVAPGTMLAVQDQTEVDICRLLHERVRRETTRRNDVLHGDWWTREANATLVRLKPRRAKGVRTIAWHRPEDIEKFSDEIDDLGALVSEFGCIALLDHHPSGLSLRVRDIFALEGKRGKQRRVVRKGPLAESVQFP